MRDTRSAHFRQFDMEFLAAERHFKIFSSSSELDPGKRLAEPEPANETKRRFEHFLEVRNSLFRSPTKDLS